MAEINNPWKDALNDIDSLYNDPSFLKKEGTLLKELQEIMRSRVRSRSAIYSVTARMTYGQLTRGISAPEDFEQAAKASFMADLEKWLAVLPQQPIDVLKPDVDKWHKSWKKPPHPDFPNILPWQDDHLALLAVRLCRRIYEDPLQYINPQYYQERNDVAYALLKETHSAILLPLEDLTPRMHTAMLFASQQETISMQAIKTTHDLTVGVLMDFKQCLS